MPFLWLVDQIEEKKFAVYKKQIKNKIQNKQTEKFKHCPAAITSSCKTLRLSNMG